MHPAMIPPLFTPVLPGCGGAIRMRDEDFEVEEVPSYEPSGEGDHLYLWIGAEYVGHQASDERRVVDDQHTNSGFD